MSSKEPDIYQKESIVTNTYPRNDCTCQTSEPFHSSMSSLMQRLKAEAKSPVSHLSLCGGD